MSRKAERNRAIALSAVLLALVLVPWPAHAKSMPSASSPETQEEVEAKEIRIHLTNGYVVRATAWGMPDRTSFRWISSSYLGAVTVPLDWVEQVTEDHVTVWKTGDDVVRRKPMPETPGDGLIKWAPGASGMGVPTQAQRRTRPAQPQRRARPAQRSTQRR